APPAVGLVEAEIADREPDIRLRHVGRLARDEVDRSADRAGREDRRGAAAHDLDAVHGSVDAHELIRVVERELVDRIDRQTVLHQADVAIAAVLNDAAREHVTVRRAGRRLDPEARHRFDQGGGALRRLPAKILGLERRDRDARFVLRALRRCRAGHDDLLHRERRGLLFGVLDGLGKRRGGNHGYQRQMTGESAKHLRPPCRAAATAAARPLCVIRETRGAAIHMPSADNERGCSASATPYSIRLPLARSKRWSRSRANAKRAVSPGRGTALGDARPTIRWPSRSPTTQTSSPVGSASSTRAASARGSSEGPDRRTSGGRTPTPISSIDTPRGNARSGTSRASMKFIGGLPTKPATNMFAGA